jgi:hypothetical protein
MVTSDLGDAFFGGTFEKVPPSPFKTFWEKF